MTTWAICRTSRLKQVDAVNETTQHLMDARINLSRAGTRMVRGGAEPTDIVQHAREQLTAADQSFARVHERAEDQRRKRRPRRRARRALQEAARRARANSCSFSTRTTSRPSSISRRSRSRTPTSASRTTSCSSATPRAARRSIRSTPAWRRFRVVSIVILLALVAGTFACYAALRRGVVAPLEEAGRHFDRIAQGRLDQPIAARGTNEIGRLFSGLAKMQASVARTVQTVRESADSIHLGADEIATGNADLSARTENQAASLEETASSMEELTATVRQNADHAREANALAETALEATSRGSEVVNEVVDKMRGIAQSSDKIAEIISVIDGIAFQTNILALNAAVEAARAGEQGRGFAVVAGEVRGLAQRSAQSAKEIKTLISESVAEIQGGSTLVEHAGEAMSNVSASISRVTQMMAEISASSLEQSTGIEQVNQAVVQMDEMTQQNAALVEQAAAAAASLHQQTQQLKQAVSVFEISETVLRTQQIDEMRGPIAEFALIRNARDLNQASA